MATSSTLLTLLQVRRAVELLTYQSLFAHCLRTRSGWWEVVASPRSEPNDVTPTCYPCTRVPKCTVAPTDLSEESTMNIQHHRSAAHLPAPCV